MIYPMIYPMMLSNSFINLTPTTNHQPPTPTTNPNLNATGEHRHRKHTRGPLKPLGSGTRLSATWTTMTMREG